jgi:MATE family multidrug resistance protein
MTPREELAEPLLSAENERDADDSDDDNDDDAQTNENENNVSVYTLRSELVEMASLALPLAVSFFCRMGMASTDSAFVGHINDAEYTAQTYLAAAVLSDMCVNVFMVPPLAFNQVLNALVGQAVGSGNPKMAGVWLQQSCFWLTVTMLPCLIGCFYVEPVLLLLAFPADVAQVAGVYAKFNVVWPIPST